MKLLAAIIAQERLKSMRTGIQMNKLEETKLTMYHAHLEERVGAYVIPRTSPLLNFILLERSDGGHPLLDGLRDPASLTDVNNWERAIVVLVGATTQANNDVGNST